MLLTEIKAAMVLCCAMLGYGIIALPIACAKVGYVGGIGSILLAAVVTFLTFELMFKSSKKFTEPDPETGEEGTSKVATFFTLTRSVHKVIAYLTILVNIIYLFLFTVTYHRNITIFSKKLINMIFEVDVPPYILAIAVTVIELGFTIPKDLGVLSNVSYASIVSCLYVGLLCVYYASMKPEIEVTVIDLSGFSNSFGIFISALACTGTIPVVFNELGKKANTTLVSVYTVSIGTIMCIIMTIAGYFCGGDDILKREVENIIDYLALSEETPIKQAISEGSFDTGGICIIVACAFFTLILIITYAITCYTTILSIMELISMITGQSPGETSIKYIRIILGPLYVSLTLVISLFGYSETFLNWNGIIFGNYITYIAPALCYIGVCGKEDKLWFPISILIIIFALFCMLYSIGMEIMNMI